uniref:Uncharacterized protein n=1 Tax=Tanacetum cinerariifolium TaxID=118510 RepID=A0A6L2NNY8_TANCI|nr:hypothetical protein [Tanacetum cinerariifolium]
MDELPCSTQYFEANTFYDNSHPLDVLNDHFEIFSDFNDDCTSSDGDSFEDMDYVEESPPYSELVSLEEVKDDILREKLLNIHLLIAKIEYLNDNLTPNRVLMSPSPFPIPVKDSDSFFEKSDTSLSYLDHSLPEFKTFSDHTKETSSGSTTTHADNFLPKPNGDALRKCILNGPYIPTTVVAQVVAATYDSLAVLEHTTVEKPMNMSPANKAHFESEKEAIHLILTIMGNEIYSTIDACQTAQEMWEAIERLQQGESLNIQDVKINLFWEFASSHTTTRYKGKEIAKPITPPSESASEDDSDLEQAQRDKDMQKNLALIAKYFKRIYKPTNNNLKTSSNLRNKNVHTTPRYKNNNQSGQFGNQRMMNVAGARKNVGTEKGVPLQVEQYDWLADMDEEIDEQELEAHYNYMSMI